MAARPGAGAPIGGMSAAEIGRPCWYYQAIHVPSAWPLVVRTRVGGVIGMFQFRCTASGVVKCQV
jgi:hypothetical protein